MLAQVSLHTPKTEGVVAIAGPGGPPGAIDPARVALLGLAGLTWSLWCSTGFLLEEFAGPLIEAVGKAAAEAASATGGAPDLLRLLRWLWTRGALLAALAGGHLEGAVRAGRVVGRAVLRCCRERRERDLTAEVPLGLAELTSRMWQEKRMQVLVGVGQRTATA